MLLLICLKFVFRFTLPILLIFGLIFTVTNKMNEAYIKQFDEIFMNDINLEISKL